MINSDPKITVYLREEEDYYEAVAVNIPLHMVEVIGWSWESSELALEHLKLALWSFGIDTPIEVEE